MLLWGSLEGRRCVGAARRACAGPEVQLGSRRGSVHSLHRCELPGMGEHVPRNPARLGLLLSGGC